MAIQQGATNSFAAELPQALHNFGPAGDTFMMALYTADASLGPTTTVYSATDEVQGVGYIAGGKALTVSVAPTSDGEGTVYWSFDNPVWDPAAFTARAALIYNATNGNRSVCVLDFGADKTATQTFTVQMPAATNTASILRILQGASL